MTEDPRYTELRDEPLPIPPDPYVEREASRRRNSYLLVALAAVVCVLGAVLAVNGLTGGSGGSPQTAVGSDEAGVAGTKQAAPTGTKKKAPAPPADLVLFKSPSGNIGCALSTRGARCDIDDKDWKPPAEPADCEGDWGVGVSVAAKSAALVCATDTVLRQGKALAYGSSLERGDYRCDSSEHGMRCENTKTGHGFTIARAKYTTF